MADLYKKLTKWLLGDSDQRAQPRWPASLITVYFHEGGVNVAHQLRDISLSGAYLYTSQRWYPGTLVRLSLQTVRPVGPKSGVAEPGAFAQVWAKVGRHGDDGVGVQFVNMTDSDKSDLKNLLELSLAGSIKSRGSESGGSLIELTLIVPILFLLLLNTVNFGMFIFAWITLADAAREGVQYAALAGINPSYSQIQTVVNDTTASLRNKSSVSVVYSLNNNGTITCPGQGTCTVTPPADPEPASYTLACVDVSYTYVPVVSAFNFPRLNIALTLPSTTVHRRAVMRVNK